MCCTRSPRRLASRSHLNVALHADPRHRQPLERVSPSHLVLGSVQEHLVEDDIGTSVHE